MKFIGLLIVVVCIAIITIVYTYTKFDSLQFRLSTFWHRESELVVDWAELLCKLAAMLPPDSRGDVPALAAKLSSTRKSRVQIEQTAALIAASAALHASIPEDGEALSLYYGLRNAEAALADFFPDVNEYSREYNDKLDRPVMGAVGRLLGLRKLPMLEL